jgi:ubiquinone/menaquinone biosynthesis C-methylase UbiE
VDSAEQTEQTRRFFDTAASGWTARYTNDAAVAARKARFLTAVQARNPQSAEILDFGCGSGDIALNLGAAGHRLTGYDLSVPMIEQARRFDVDQKVLWIARAANASEALPFADASFDAVLTSSVLEYVPELDATLKELARVLRPGGWFFATVPDMRDPHRHRERWLRIVLAIPGMRGVLAHSRWREGAGYLRISINRMAPQSWQSRLRASGFAPEDLPESTDPLMLLVASKA